MLTGLSGGEILATCGGLTPGSAAKKSLSAGGPEHYSQMIQYRKRESVPKCLF